MSRHDESLHFFFYKLLFISNLWLQLLHCVGFPFGTDLPPPPEPPPCQGQSRIQGARSISSMVPPTERKASSLERTPMSGALSGPEDMKSSIDRQARTSIEHHRQTQDRLGSMDRADDGRRGHKTGSIEVCNHANIFFLNTVCFVNASTEVVEDEKGWPNCRRFTKGSGKPIAFSF